MARNRSQGGDLAVTGGEKEFGYYQPRNHWGSRLAPYAPEWVGGLAVWPVAWGAHLWFTAGDTMPWASAGLTLLGGGLTALTYYCARARAAIVRRFATATTGVTAAWTTAATIAGPTASPLLELWAFGGAGVALSWTIYKALKRGGDSESGGDSLFDKVKLSGVKAGELDVKPNKVSGPLQLPPGEMDVADVQKASDKIASALGLHKGAVRISDNPDDASQATITVVARDVLRQPTGWPGLSAPGGSILDPLVLGVYDDAEPVKLWLPGDKTTGRNATHVQVNGMNGSGKSGMFKLGAAEILSRRDATLVVLDPSKGDQTVQFLQGSRAHTVTQVKKCQKLLKALPQVITDRASQLGQWGYDQWVPEAFTQHGMPYLVLWIEEATKLLRDAETLATIAQEARSAGISLVLSQQKSSYRQMNTDIRSQLGAAACFGVKDPEDASYSLSDDTLDAGAHPERWKNFRPGCLYLEAPGIDPARHATPGRTFEHVDEALTAAIADCAEHNPGLDTATAAGLGLPGQNTAEDEPSTQEGGTVVSLPTATAPVADAEPDLEQDPELDELADFDDDPDNPEAGLIPLPEVHEPELEVDPTAELPEETDTTELPQPKPPLTEARANLRQWLAEHHAAGRTILAPRDVPEHLHGRSRPWVSAELADLAHQGVLVRAGDGQYTYPPSSNAA